MEPLISIGIPVKDGFKNKTDNDINLKKALDSVLKQSYQNIEIIISNNCSTDNTKIFLDKISETDQRIKIFNQKKEISSGENFQFVFDKSKGKYFRWNASDDFMSQNYIKDNFNFLEKNKDYIASSSKFFFENHKNYHFSHNLNKNLYSRLKHFFNIRYSSHNIFYSLIRTKNLKKVIRMSKDCLAIDWMVNLDLLLNGKFKTIEESYIIFGVKGISKSKNFLKNEQYNNKKIYSLLPLYELTKNFFTKTIFMKELSVAQKTYLYYLCIKANLSFLKKRAQSS